MNDNGNRAGVFEYFWENFDYPIDTEERCGVEIFDNAEDAMERLDARTIEHPNSANVVIEVTEGDNYEVLALISYKGKGKRAKWFYELMKMLYKSEDQ